VAQRFSAAKTGLSSPAAVVAEVKLCVAKNFFSSLFSCAAEANKHEGFSPLGILRFFSFGSL
jgi:hypothetical protein